MAGIFKNNFFSIAGQKERISNAVQVLAQSLNPFSNAKPVANVNNKVAKAALEFVAANPYTTAAAVAIPASSPARAAVASAVSKLSTTTKVVAAATGLVAVPAIVSSPKTQAAAINTASKFTPEKLVSLGKDFGKVVENPSVNTAKNLVKDNAVLLGAAGIVAGLSVGSKVIPAVSNYVATRATKENTEAVLANTSVSSSSKNYEPTIDLISQKKSTPTYTADVLEIPATPASSAPPTLAQTEKLKSSVVRRKKKRSAKPTSINQRVSLVINNKNSISKRYLNQRCYG